MNKVYLLLSLLVMSGSANSAILNVNSMSITGGEVTLSGAATYQLLTGDVGPLVMGTYQGSPACCSPAAAETTLVYFQLGFFGWAGVHTAESDDISSQAPLPSGFVDTSDNTLNVDLSAWTWTFNGASNHVGASDIVGSYDAVTGEYDLSWSSVITSGGFVDQTLDWHITGVANVSAVPLPASIWLFASGIIGLYGMSKRRQTK